MVVFKPQMCFAGLLMTLAEKKRAGKRAGALPGSSPHPQAPGSCGAGRGVRAGASLDLLRGGGLGGHPGAVQPRSPSAAAVLGKSVLPPGPMQIFCG